jgi:glucarate dehydratase
MNERFNHLRILMKIKDLRIHSIAIAGPTLRSSYGLHAPYALRTIMELESEDGIVGINETYGGEAQAAALMRLRPQIIGSNAYKITGLLNPDLQQSKAGDNSQTHFVPGENPLMRSVAPTQQLKLLALTLSERATACLFVTSSVDEFEIKFPFSIPFYKHAGGGGEGNDEREDEYGEALSAETLVKQVKKMIEQYGFGSVKFKAGVLDPEIEVETVKQMYKAFGPDVPLRIDPNSAWSVDTSVKVGEALAVELGRGGYLEDPTASIAGMAEVRKRLKAKGLDVPLASNVAVTSFEDLPETVAKDAVQIILCDHHYWGGMRRVQQLARLAKLLVSAFRCTPIVTSVYH